MKTLDNSVIQSVPLEKVTVSHNPRKPLKKLQELGFDPMVFCHDYGLHTDSEKRNHFVSTIRENHPEIERMAQSLEDKSQIQPVILREFKVDNEINYGIACGERRFIARVFMQALTNNPCPIRAEVRKLTIKEAYWLGVEENLIREDMGEIEKGEAFARYAKENNDLPLTEVAKHFHVEYPYVRGRVALATKLPENRLKLYEEGELGLTDAIKEALGEPSHRSKPLKSTRRSILTAKQVEGLFDTTDKNNQERLQALAEVLKLDLQTALTESENRLKQE